MTFSTPPPCPDEDAAARDAELERELRTLAPQAMPAALRTRLLVAIRTAETERTPAAFGWPRWTWQVATGLLVVTALGVSWWANRPPAPVATSLPQVVADRKAEPEPTTPETALRAGDNAAFETVGAANLLAGARNDGWVVLPDGQRARQVTYRLLDTVEWRNPQTGAVIQLQVPREETIFMVQDTL